MKISRDELLVLLNNIASEITEQMLANNPKYLLVLRLNAGLSQNQFEDFLGISKNSYKYETGKIKRMNLKTAKKFLARINSKIDKKKIIKNYEKFEAESKGWIKANSESEKALKARQKGAHGSLLKRSTVQEKEVVDCLSKKSLSFKKNFAVNSKCIVDFKIEQPNMVIECKRLVTANRREQTKKIRELAYQGYKAKFYDRNITLVAIIETELSLRSIDYEELMGPFDKVFDGIDSFIFYLDQTI